MFKQHSPDSTKSSARFAVQHSDTAGHAGIQHAAVPFSPVVQRFSFEKEEEAEEYFREKLLPDLAANREEALKLKDYALDKEWKALPKQIDGELTVLSKEHALLLEKNRQTPIMQVFEDFLLRNKIDIPADTFAKEVEEAHRPDISTFTEGQATYQKLLSDTLHISTAQIMDFHQSAGYEYEFASFKDTSRTTPLKEDEELLPSHTGLAFTPPFSNVLKLPFKLETDSGNSLEIATAPFILLASAQSKGLLGQVFDMYTHASQHLEKELCAPQDVLINKGNAFQQSGFGTGWAFTGAATHLTAIPNEKHKQGAYGQVNISLSADEIVDFLQLIDAERQRHIEVKGWGDKTKTTKLLYEYYQLMQDNYKPAVGEHPAMKGAFLLYSRSAANILAIPSILQRQDNRDSIQKPHPNYATEIKESMGLWVKDNPHKVLLDYMRQLGNAGGDFVETMDQSEAAMIDKLGMYLDLNKADVRNWFLAKHKLRQSEEAERIKVDAVAANRIQDTGQKATAQLQIRQRLLANKQPLDSAIDEDYDKWANDYRAIAIQELKAFNQQIRTGGRVIHASDRETEFLGETFGTGEGVRKDTYLPGIRTPHRDLRVGEIRGRAELKLYEGEKGEDDL